MGLLSVLFSIVVNVLGPILLMVAIGALVRRRFKLDVGTLAKINLYIFSPAFIFDRVAHSTLSWTAMSGVVGITLIQVVTLGVIVYGVGSVSRAAPKTVTAMALATIFYNSGNFGIPLAELAYPGTLGERDGAATQAFVILCQNFLVFTLGMYLASRDQPHRQGWKGAVRAVLSTPAVPVLVLALLCRAWLKSDPSHTLPAIVEKPVSYLSLALVPIALVTLGAQLGGEWRWPRWRPVMTVCALRLVLGPIQMAVLLFGFHKLGWLNLWPWPAQLLIVTAAVPSAVNTLLLTIETEGDVNLAADCVFWTTLLCPLTLTATLAVVKLGFG